VRAHGWKSQRFLPTVPYLGLTLRSSSQYRNTSIDS
jgi:hypothetical protein